MVLVISDLPYYIMEKNKKRLDLYKQHTNTARRLVLHGKVEGDKNIQNTNVLDATITTPRRKTNLKKNQKNCIY